MTDKPKKDAKTKRTNAVTTTTRAILWAQAAGRCEYAGCNKSLIGDLVSGAEDKNFGFVAHIVADDPKGPRGDEVRSPLLSNAVSNLMLMCHVHHKLIDVDEVNKHPEERLVQMKSAHERRIAIVTDIQDDRASYPLRYAANIGNHESPVAYEHVAAAMLPEWYPADGRAIDIGQLGSAVRDDEPDFWKNERMNLQRQFAAKVLWMIEAREIRHISVFALAPQPLLIELGRLLGDITPAEIYQLHREPKGWKWPEPSAPIEYEVTRPDPGGNTVALILALSATVGPTRVTQVLGPDTAIWTIAAKDPYNDLMKNRSDLASFSRLVRTTLNEIKAQHGEDVLLHVFPAMPVSAAVEMGRAWMPKADLPLVLYDQHRATGGFARAFQIGGETP